MMRPPGSQRRGVNAEPIGHHDQVGDGSATDLVGLSDDDLAGLSGVLLAALEHTRSATCITTAELDEPGPRIVYVNPAYCEMTGRRREDVIGRTPRLMQGPLTDRRELDRLRTDLSAGRSFAGETVNYRADGTPFIINWSIDAVRSTSGETTHYIATQQDVTEQVRANALLAAGRRLDATLAALLDASMRAADATQILADEIASGAESIAGVGTVGVVLSDGRGRADARSGSPDAESPIAEHFDVARAGSPVGGRITISGLTEAEVLFLDRDGLQQFADRAGIVGAALLEYLQQRSTAERLQRTMLPPADLSAPGWSVATHYEPGALGLEVGGDWYDVLSEAGRVVFAVGDVSGSGVGAAMLMGRLRLLAELELTRGGDIPAVVRLLDAECREQSSMATLAMVEVDVATGSTRLWTAGHLPPVIVAGGCARLADVVPAPPLGFVSSEPDWTPLELGAGDGVLLFTDGLVERRSESIDRGLDRLVAAVDPDADVADLIAQAVEGCAPAGDDDVAILAFRRVRSDH